MKLANLTSMMVLERRHWPNVFYVFLFILTCLTIWQLTTVPSVPTVIQFQNPVYTLNTINSTVLSLDVDSLQPNDYNRLINISFSFKMLNLVCNHSSPLLLILVHSAPRNFAKRATIRDTWGGNTHQIRVLFFIGLVEDAQLQNKLEEESQINSDLVQGTFIDTYRNLTYKHIMLFKYVIYHCPQVKYVLKTDDDVFVNIPTMLNVLKNNLSPYGACRILFCTVRRNVKPERSYRSKWRVSFLEYPDKMYPTYCPGWALLYSPDVIFDLYKEAQKTKYFWIDDLHITGMLAEKAHIFHTDVEPFVLSKNSRKTVIESRYFDVNNIFLYGGYDLKENDIRTLWKYVKHRPIPKNMFVSNT